MTHSLNSFKNAFSGGTRANRFIVIPNFPSLEGLNSSGFSNLQNKCKFTVTSASLPKVDIGVIAVPYRGRMAYYAGDRQYSVWPIKVYDDNDRTLWNAFHLWKESLDGHITHLVNKGSTRDHKTLQTTWSVEQLPTNGTVAHRRINLIRCWPSEIGGINLDMGSSEFVSFDMTLTFDHIEIARGL